MTKSEAIAIRTAQLNGEPVRAGDLQDAIFTLSKRRNRRFVLPKLAADVRERANAVLCFNLGRAIGGAA
jgi:hypothetical protein